MQHCIVLYIFSFNPCGSLNFVLDFGTPAHTHTHTHARTHARTHTYTHTRAP